MPKFSIIIPVYGVENYIKKCLDSVFSQTYNDMEVIVVNDGTKDNSMAIVNQYPVKIINQENAGLSAARNTGVTYATGEYLFFLDKVVLTRLIKTKSKIREIIIKKQPKNILKSLSVSITILGISTVLLTPFTMKVT